jgi:hypothetical protein
VQRDEKPRFRLDHGRLVPIQELEPGSARNTNEFSNRGLPDAYGEVTIWPKRLVYRLTSGAQPHVMGKPDPVKLSRTEEAMAKILGLNELELGVFLRSWATTENHQRSKRPQTPWEFQRALHEALGHSRRD